MRSKSRRLWGLITALVMALALLAPAALAHPDPDDGGSDGSANDLHAAGDLSTSLVEHDSTMSGIISSGPFAKVIKNVDARGIGARDVANATTDVWALNGYAYTGTFNNPCGGTEGGGVWIWDVHNKNKVDFVGIIPSPDGSRSNDVRAASMNSGDILVHSNEACAGGPGGFEIYNVDDPENPVSLASVQTDDVNIFIRDNFGFTDFGVHNLFLFSHGANDYVAATVESLLGNFQIYDITDPTDPKLVGWWGAEELGFPGVDFRNTADLGVIVAAQTYLNEGFGASQNRFLHDVTISDDGTHAYLANWDAGLVLLDISNPADPQLVSVAIDPTSEDGEVNSHSVWPNEDGTIVIEGEEDFAPFATEFSITSGPGAGEYAAAEGAITVPIASLPGGEMSGPTRYVGGACPVGNPGFDDPVPPAQSGEIALILRGACFFTEKIDNAAAAGYAGVVVMNDEARGDALVSMGGNPTTLPGVFVGHSTGLTIAGAANQASLVIDTTGESVLAATVADGWSGVRVWDYSDPANPVLASTFNTVCSANPIDPSCDPAGTYSVHNVQVETTGNKVRAYISWYSDGMLILDISDPYNPVEVGRYTEEGTDFWGVYKEKNSPFFYGSDRNGGLYIFKEQGSGSGKK